MTLVAASNAMMGAAMGMQGADVAPTDRQVAACASARKLGAEVMPKWSAVKTRLAAFNAKRRAAGQPEVTLPK